MLAVSVVIGGVGIAAYAGGWFDEEAAQAEPTTTTLPPTTTTTVAPPTVPVSTTLVSAAVPGSDFATFDAPNGRETGLAGHWYGFEQTMPVVAEQPGWYQVRMPERPNGSTAWVRAEDVTVSTTPYRIELNVTTTRVTIYKDGYFSFDMPGVFGKSSTPTPLGNYYVAVVERDVPGGYGSVVLDLSAHSEAIKSFQGSGDAIIALHGPFGVQETIRSGGGHLSNGCIRLLPEDQLKLDVIPIGTPVDIVA